MSIVTSSTIVGWSCIQALYFTLLFDGICADHCVNRLQRQRPLRLLLRQVHIKDNCNRHIDFAQITTTAYETSTLSLVSTTTIAAPNGFSPIVTSFPDSSYDDSTSQQPIEKRDSIIGARGGKSYKKQKGLKKSGKIPNKVTCVQHKPNSQCKVKSVTATKTTGCKGKTVTVTATATQKAYTYPAATTTITTLTTATSTTTAFITDSTTTTATETTYTSTTTEYAACATNNFANLYQGQGFSNAVPVADNPAQDGDILFTDNAYE